MRAPCIIQLLALAGSSWAATVTATWNINWITAAPDGFSRPVIGINGVWPCPLLEANVGDTVVVTVNNNLGNETTGLHFHGIRQYGTPDMDGTVSASQCPVPPGSSITYTFVVCNTKYISVVLKLRDNVDSFLFIYFLSGRSMNQGHIGTTHTTWASTLTG